MKELQTETMIVPVFIEKKNPQMGGSGIRVGVHCQLTGGYSQGRRDAGRRLKGFLLGHRTDY